LGGPTSAQATAIGCRAESGSSRRTKERTNERGLVRGVHVQWSHWLHGNLFVFLTLLGTIFDVFFCNINNIVLLLLF
jgi:hypothetical protein